VLKKKIWANFQRIIELFTQKIVTKLSKIWVRDPRYGIRDPRSGKNLFRIPDPGVKKAPDPGSGSATLKSGAEGPQKNVKSEKKILLYRNRYFFIDFKEGLSNSMRSIQFFRTCM
jgi:hypothetical protein